MDIKTKCLLSIFVFIILCVFQVNTNNQEHFSDPEKRDNAVIHINQLNKRGQKLYFFDSSWKIANNFQAIPGNIGTTISLRYKKTPDSSFEPLFESFNIGTIDNFNGKPKIKSILDSIGSSIDFIYAKSDNNEIFFYHPINKMWVYATERDGYKAYIYSDIEPYFITTKPAATPTKSTIPTTTTIKKITKLDVFTPKKVYIDSKVLNKSLMISWSKPDFFGEVGIFNQEGIYDKNKKKEFSNIKINQFKFNKAEINYFIIIEKTSNLQSFESEKTKFRVIKKTSTDKHINIVIDKKELIGHNHIYVISQYKNIYQNNNIEYETYSEPSNRIVFSIEERPDNQFTLFKKPDEHINKEDYAGILNLLLIHINRKIPSVIEVN